MSHRHEHAAEASKEDPKAKAKAEKEAAKAAKEAEKAAKAAKKVKQNGIVRPSPDTATGKIWGFADKLSKEKGSPARRKDVLEAAAAAGINTTTAATQYGRWCKFYGVKAEREPAASKEEKKAA